MGKPTQADNGQGGCSTAGSILKAHTGGDDTIVVADETLELNEWRWQGGLGIVVVVAVMPSGRRAGV
jgi:hypothetical protein